METSDVQDGDQQIEAKAIRLSISSLDKKFRKACDQILLLNNQIDELQVRYDRCVSYTGCLPCYGVSIVQ